MGRVGSAAEHGRIQGRGWPNTRRSNTAWPSALPPHLPNRGEEGRGNQVRVPRAGFSHELVDEDEEQKAFALRGQAPYLRRCRGNAGAKAGPRSLCSPAEAPCGVRPSESGVGCGRKPNPVPDQGAAEGGGPAKDGPDPTGGVAIGPGGRPELIRSRFCRLAPRPHQGRGLGRLQRALFEEAN